MNNSLHVFFSAAVVAVNYLFMWFGKGDQSILLYTNIAVFVSLGLITVSSELVSIWKK